MYNLILLFTYYFIIIISILGYGLYFLKLLDKKITNNNFGYVGLFGLYTILIYSYVSNFFFAHSYTHNILLITLGIILFLVKFLKHYSQFKKEIFLTFIVFFLISSTILLHKNHDDFPYYHFPYTYYLTQQSFYIGVGQFNHGFRTPSSILYLNSLFYLPGAKFYLFHFTAIYILGFTNIILLKKIHNFFDYFRIQNQKINHINYLSLLSLIFINIFFARIAEHGTDRSAQILIFLLIIEILVFAKLKKNKESDLFNIYLLGAIIISLKAFYILYILFIVPLIYLVRKKNQNYIKTIIFLFFNKYCVMFLSLLSLVLFTYFINTGCLIYPVSMTCFESFAWSIPISEVEKMNNHYEVWSKGGLTPNSRVTNPDEYITGFNWVSNWMNIYFFNKVSDFILGISVLIIIVGIFFKKQFFQMKINKIRNYIYIIYFIIVILGVEWFFNHPALRYGGYCIIALIFFIPICLKLESKKINYKKYTKNIFILIFVAVLALNMRNVIRINKEIKIYNYEPIKNTFYFTSSHYFRIQVLMDEFLIKYRDCLAAKKDCKLEKQKIIKEYGKIIFKNK